MSAGSVWYEVTAVMERQDDFEAYAQWLAEKHIGDVVAAGALSGELIVRTDRDDGAYEVVCEYRFADREAFDAYAAGPQPGLRADTLVNFGPETGRAITWTAKIGRVQFASPGS